jgi:hypothetical protein
MNAEALAALFLSVQMTAPADADPRFGHNWTPAQRRQIYRYYEPVTGLTNSSHWHDWDCCQSNRCFPARSGSVKWTPNGIAIVHPDGDVGLYSEHDERWKEKKGAGLKDPRAHICWEIEGGKWVLICGYRGGVQG